MDSTVEIVSVVTTLVTATLYYMYIIRRPQKITLKKVLAQALVDNLCCVLAHDERFEIQTVRGNGNCLFHAVAVGYSRIVGSQQKISRLAYITWTIHHYSLGSPLSALLDLDTMKESIQRISKGTIEYGKQNEVIEYGEQDEIMILSHMLSENSNQKIGIACFNARPSNKCPSSMNPKPASNQHRWFVYAPYQERCKWIFIRNYGKISQQTSGSPEGEHFDALIPKSSELKSKKTIEELTTILYDEAIKYPQNC